MFANFLYIYMLFLNLTIVPVLIYASIVYHLFRRTKHLKETDACL
jgi:hypothetical protein